MITSFIKNATIKPCCEDFASYKKPDLENDGYMLLTDGCSSSNGDVVLGSRIYHGYLSRLAQDKTVDIYNGFKFLDHVNAFFSLNYSGFSYLMNSGKEDYLFTILFAHLSRKNDNIDLIFCGDGYLYVEDNNGNHNIIGFDYDNNTPYYFCYSDEESKEVKMNKFNLVGNEEIPINGKIQDDKLYVCSLKYSEISRLFMFTDGVERIFGGVTKDNLSPERFITEVCKDPRMNSEDYHFPSRKAKYLLKNRTLGDDVGFVGLVK